MQHAKAYVVRQSTQSFTLHRHLTHSANKKKDNRGSEEGREEPGSFCLKKEVEVRGLCAYICLCGCVASFPQCLAVILLSVVPRN